MGVSTRARVGLSYTVEEVPSLWRLEEEDVPEIPLHDAVIELLMLILKQSVAKTGRSALICSNLGCRWDPEDARVGMDPDVVLIEPAPPEGERLTTLRVWEFDHVPPRLAVEVVSRNDPAKDYLDAPLRAARLGTPELWVFDPLLAGPSLTGGPFRLQVWRRIDSGDMQRHYAGPGPAFSPELEAWVVVTQGGDRLRIAHDPDGRSLWPTAAEAEQKVAEAERRRAEAAEAELRSLKAKLGRDD